MSEAFNDWAPATMDKPNLCMIPHECICGHFEFGRGFTFGHERVSGLRKILRVRTWMGDVQQLLF